MRRELLILASKTLTNLDFTQTKISRCYAYFKMLRLQKSGKAQINCL